MLRVILLIVIGVPFLSLMGYYWYLAQFRRDRFLDAVHKIPRAHLYSDQMHLNAVLIGFPLILLQFVVTVIVLIMSQR